MADFSVCWPATCKDHGDFAPGFVRVDSMSSPTLLAEFQAITALAVNQRPSINASACASVGVHAHGFWCRHFVFSRFQERPGRSGLEKRTPVNKQPARSVKVFKHAAANELGA
jgi:hypothetical protein